jgi:tripartite-type tricarboxylate transporter receptor subunit TctC
MIEQDTEPDCGQGSNAMKLRHLAIAVMLLVLPAALTAQTNWPASPVRIIMPYPPATSGDLISRKVAAFLSQKLNASFYVDNRPGANGNIGMKAAKDAAPDGNTYIAATDIQFAVSPALYADLPYDVDRDFTPVAPLARVINVIVANRNVQADNLEQLVALAKAQPGKITYASTGVGSTHQLFMEMLKMRGGFDMVHVPYKGTGEATPDLISGQVDVMFFGAPQALAQVKAGQLKVLAVGSPNRLPEFPGVPTIAESGFPGFTSTNIWGVWAPAGTPDTIVAKLRQAIAQALADPDIRDWYRFSVLSTLDGGVDQMVDEIRAERAKWPEVVKAANIKLVQ